MRAGERVGVAVSGGADSVALLRLLLEARDELGIVLSVAHFNHKLRGEESDADEAFVRELAGTHGLEFFCESGDTRGYAGERKCGLEAAARELRYAFFWRLMGYAAEGGRGPAESRGLEGRPGEGAGAHNAAEKIGLIAGAGAYGHRSIVDRIATAHTMDDQAETVVLRVARGAGTRGMAGIYPVVTADNQGRLPIDDCRSKNASAEVAEGQRTQSGPDDNRYRSVTGGTPVLRSGAIVRPLLEFRRAQLRHYLRRAGQPWREDASNEDLAFLRNKVRQDVMPKLRELNPAVEMVLGETAEIARAEEEYWRDVVGQALREVSNSSHGGHDGLTKAVVDVPKLMNLTLALRRRVVRELAERAGLRLEFHHVEQVLEVASGGAARAEKRVELTEGWDACVMAEQLRLERRSERKAPTDYDLPLTVPGEVRVDCAGLVLRARLTDSGKRLKPGQLRVRNWRPGDRYWPAYTGSEKKIKELLQDRRVPAETRAFWPVVMTGEEIVWVPGFAYPEKWVTENGEGVVLEFEKQS